jgi:hypothetical protein
MMVTVTDNPIEVLREVVDERGGVYTIPMMAIRDFVGAKRITRRKCDELSEQFDKHGLIAVPALEPDQNQQVRLIVADSQVADLLKAINEPDDRTDEVLRRASKTLTPLPI